MTSSDKKVGSSSPTTTRSTARGSCARSRRPGRSMSLAEAEDGRQALKHIEEHQPEVAVLDYKLPELDGLQVTHAVIRDGLPTRVLMLSAFTESGIVYKALEAGVAGYLPKEARREQIADAVLACARGEHVVPPEVAAGLVSEIRLRATNDAPALTERERQVLKSISEARACRRSPRSSTSA